MGQDYNEMSDMLQASDMPMPTATSSNVEKLPEFKIQFHLRSNQPLIYQSYEEFHVFSEKSPSLVDKTPWSPFHMLGDSEFVEITLTSLLNQQQVNALLDLFAHVTQGAVQVTLRNDAELHKFSRVKVKVPYKKEECTMALSMNISMTSPGPEIIGGIFNLPNIKNAVPFGLILYADKSNLSSFGTAKSYPIIVCRANLLVEIWNSNVVGGGTVVGWLPIVPEDAKEEGKLGYTTLKHVIWHESFKKLLLEIEQCSKTGCMMALTHGHGGKCPCLGIDALCVHAMNRAEGNELLKWLGLRPIKVIVKALGQQIEADIKKYVASFPRWQNLTHFNQVIHVTFSDGNKLANISKQIFYTGINVLKKSITPEGLIGLDVQTECMVNVINNEILTFDQTLKDYTKCVVKSNIDGLQTDWNFLKGATCNYSTQPNESMHKPIRDAYEHHSNGRDIPAQVLWVDHQDLATKLLRLCVDHLEKSISGESDPEVDAVSEHTSVDHIKLGAHVIMTQTLKDLEENGQPDMAFHRFRQRFFNSWISLPADFTLKLCLC
ncbi:hypothetical protein F5J12DRAFT_787334 [Pisolithus orientalis]|uniref:uncharacterized protein n=1 Tax=Pisolithus orientalis TaxID=936130 RepID=UPI00222455DC|nr:uncharacterized protein F5J12DRAFT_787334 [Pisolithus orientalis]KAI5985815.1 hypothetical protein F5J12DRAFT_787334 [Pisolithus orientalis]